MKTTWLGQAGLLIEADSITVMIDPYLSNSVEKVNPTSYRRQPIDECYFSKIPDVMIFTHDHLDHYDPETASRFFEKQNKSMLVLSPTSVWQKARTYGNGHNYVQLDDGTEWTEGHLHFTATPAVHSDPHAIGVLIENMKDGQTYYITGDTLYSPRVLAAIPKRVDAVFLPINGAGNNMNEVDAARFARAINAKNIIPIHFGMFDEITPLRYDERYTIPQIYQEILL